MTKAPAKAGYFSDVLIVANVVLSVVPRPLTAAMMARAMPAAIRPYSIAVAPDWSAKNLKNVCFMIHLLVAMTPGFSRVSGVELCSRVL